VSRLRFNNVTAPPAPALGKVEVFSGPDKVLRSIDDAGVVRRLGDVAADGYAATSDVVANAADTYLAAAAVSLDKLVAGSIIRWRFTATKTAAGTAAPVWAIRCGTAKAATDASVGTFTTVAQTAAADTGWWEVEAVIRALAGGVLTYSAAMKAAHKLATTGFANVAQEQLFQAGSTTSGLATSGLFLGLSVNPGTAGVWTFQTAAATAHLPAL
jgi:hypothetical protein